MGGEAFIWPWVIAMGFVAVVSSASLAKRFGVLPRGHEQYVFPDGRDGGFWLRQAMKVAAFAFAVWQIAAFAR